MVKFWFVRCRDNASPSWDHQPAADDAAPLAFKDGWGGQGPVWTRMWHWMMGDGATFGDAPDVPMSADELADQTAKLNDSAADLRAAAIEPLRVGAAYALASAGSPGLDALTAAFANGGGDHLPVDGVRRSAMYGLAAAPDNAGVPALLAGASPECPMEQRVCAVFGLGQRADPTTEAVGFLCTALAEDESAFVRSTTAHSLGFLGRRAAAQGDKAALAKVLAAMQACLDPTLMNSFSLWQMSPAEPSKVEELPAPPTAEQERLRGTPDFFEGNRGGGDIFPRSGMREHAAQGLAYICTAVARNPAAQDEKGQVPPCLGRGPLRTGWPAYRVGV